MPVNLGTMFASLDADLKPLTTGIQRARRDLKSFANEKVRTTVGSAKSAIDPVSLKTQKELLQVDKAQLTGITAQRREERNLLQQQLRLAESKRAVAAGEGSNLNQTLAGMQAQAQAKQRLIAFDAQTRQMELQKLQGMKAVTAADQARLSSQIAAKNIAMQQLGVNRQLVQSQLALASQKAQQKFDAERFSGSLGGFKKISTQFQTMRAQGVGMFTSVAQSAKQVPAALGQIVTKGGIFAGMSSGAGQFAGMLGLTASTGGLLAVALVGAGVGLVKFAGSAINAAEQVASLRLAMAAAAGGAKEGAQAFEFARSLANQLGLDLIQTAQSYKNVLAATVAGGASAEAAQFVFEGMAVGIRAMGLSSEQANRIMVATGQIMSKGKIQAEELRQQLGEHLPVAMGFLAQGLGKTTAEINKMMENGEITSEAMLNLSAQMQKAFGGKVQEQSQRLGAEWQRLKNQAFELMASMGSGGLTQVALSLVSGLKSLLGLAKTLAPVFALLIAPIADMIERFVFLIKVFAGVVTALISMSSAIGTFLMGLAPVKAAVDLIVQAFEKLGAIGSTVFGFLKEQVSTFAGFVGKIMPESVKTIFEAGKAGFKQGFTGIESEKFKPKTDAELDKQVAELAKSFPNAPKKTKKAELQAAFQQEKAELAALTAKRNEEKGILQQKLQLQTQLAAVQNQLAGGETDTLNAKIAALQTEASTKLQLLNFDRESLNLEMQKLQSIQGGSEADRTKLATQVMAKQLKLEELGLSEQLIQAELQLSTQKERQLEAQRQLQLASQFQLESTRIQSQIAMEGLKQRGMSRQELQAQEFAAEQEILGLKMQQLQAELALAQAQGLSTQELRNEIDLLRQSQELLNAEQLTFEMEPMLNQAREFASILTDGIQDFIGQLTSGTLNLGKTFQSLGQDLIQSSVAPLFQQIQGQLTKTFSSLGGMFGGLGGALFGGILVGLGSLFNRQKSQTQSLADEVRGNIEQVETVRGLIAGDQGIAVQQLNQNLAEAFRPTNDILRLIDTHIVNLINTVDKNAVISTSSRGSSEIALSVLGAPRI